MRCLHRLPLLFASPPPWLTLLVGVVLGGVLTSTFTFRLWWCSYSDMKFERETMRFAQFNEHFRDLTNVALTNKGLSSTSKCVCGPELERLKNSIPPVSKLPILEPSEKPSIHILTHPDKEDRFVPLRIQRTANETSFLNPQAKELHSLNNTPNYLDYELHTRKQLLVAVVTSESHLESASTVYDTWGADATQILFFVGKDCNASNPYLRGLPLVRLPNVMDSPVNSVDKSFSVVKYVSDNYLSEFQWFLLANDNLYVRTKKLENFLKQLSPSEKIFLGRAARGKDEDAKKLSLLPHEHYCLGSSGMVISYGLLEALSPRLEFCLNAAMVGQGSLSHPDVELGRCISRQVGVQCSQAAQVSGIARWSEKMLMVGWFWLVHHNAHCLSHQRSHSVNRITLGQRLL